MLKILPMPGPAPEHRTMPQNTQIEQGLLGAILSNNDWLDRIEGLIEPEDFWEPLHAEIYRATVKLIQSGQPANPITLKNLFENAPPVTEHVTVPHYLGLLVIQAAVLPSLESYARSLRSLAMRRQIIMLAQDMAEVAYDSPIEASGADQVEAAERELLAIAERNGSGEGAVSFAVSVETAASRILNAYRNKNSNHLIGMSTGLTDIDTITGGLRDGLLYVPAGRPGMGKAQPLDAKVLMKNGVWKRMGDMRVGDMVASIDGASSRISGIFPQGVKQIFKVTFSDGRSAEACADHLWEVKYRDWPEPRVVSTSKLVEMLKRKRYMGRLIVRMTSGHFGAEMDWPIDPWLLGVLLGDGSLSSTGVRFTTPSAYIVNGVRKAVGDGHSVKWDSLNASIVADGSTNQICRALDVLGLRGLRSHEKFVPQIYKSGSRQTRRSLLRGLLDTDGWCEKHGSLLYSSSSAQLARDVVDLARSLGYWATLKTKTAHYRIGNTKVEAKDAHIVCISGPEKDELVCRPERHERIVGRSQWRVLTIKSIEPSRTAEAQCIAVTHPSRLYVTDDYVVTHNTSFVIGIGWTVAKRKIPVHFFSLEMPHDQISERIISRETDIDAELLRMGRFDQDDARRVDETKYAIRSVPFFIDDRAAISIDQLCARARRHHRKHGTRLVIVDYLQLLSGSGVRRSDTRVNELTEITGKLKALAKELRVPVIALSQLSRAVENRDNKRPQLSDLRESGSIEQDADLVMFLYREAYYLQQRKPIISIDETGLTDDEKEKQKKAFTSWQTDVSKVAGKAEAIIAKNRFGRTQTVELAFRGATTSFYDLARQEASHGH